VAEQEIFAADCGSPGYEHLVKNIGWEIDLETHRGYTGGLNPKATGQKAVYHADWDTEIIFHVSTLMPYHSQTYANDTTVILRVVALTCNLEQGAAVQEEAVTKRQGADCLLRGSPRLEVVPIYQGFSRLTGNWSQLL